MKEQLAKLHYRYADIRLRYMC